MMIILSVWQVPEKYANSYLSLVFRFLKRVQKQETTLSGVACNWVDFHTTPSWAKREISDPNR